MLILAVETTADLCSVALRDGQGTLVERAFRHRMHLSERLIADVDSLLADAEVALADVEGFAVGLGPGSFTGVRIGVSVIKAWADVLQTPVVGISSLEAVAAEYEGLVGSVVVPLIRARPGSVYAQFSRMQPSAVEAAAPPEALTLPDFAIRMRAVLTSPPPGCILCGDGLLRYRTELEEALAASSLEVVFGRPDPPRAATLALLAERRFRAGEADDALAVAPLYVAPPLIHPRAEQLARP